MVVSWLSQRFCSIAQAYRWLLVAVICGGTSLLMAAEPGSLPESDLTLLNLPAPFDATALPAVNRELTTELVALRLSAGRLSDRFQVDDYEMVFDPAGNRFIPLLRTLSLLSPVLKLTPSSLIVSLSPAHRSEINFSTQQVIIEQQQHDFQLYRLVSDVTGDIELFVSEQVFTDALGLKFEWQDDNYQYEVTADKSLYKFQRMRQRRRSGFSAPVDEIAANLPETEPIRMPEDSYQLLSFLEVDLNASGRYNGDEFSGALTPNFTAHGQLLGGHYRLKLAKPIHFPSPDYSSALLWLDEALWSSEYDHMAVRVGDTSLGLNRLSVLSASYSGITLRGVSSDPGGNSQTFLDSSRLNFLDEREISGSAPLGSRIEIFVNNRRVHDEVVTSDLDAPIGKGKYKITGIGLTGRRLNEIKTVITYPDGVREEKIEEVVGNNALLAAGQYAYTFGAGTKRQERDKKLVLDGAFVGGGFYSGLSDNATLGLTAAFQDEFFAGNGSGNRLAKRGYLSQSLSLNLDDVWQLSQEIGANFSDEDTGTPLGAELALDYYQDNYTVSAHLFGYQEDFLNGVTPLGNRLGYGLHSRWQTGGGWLTNGAYVSVRDQDHTQEEDYLALTLAAKGIIPNTSVDLRYDQRRRIYRQVDRNRESQHLYSVNFKSQPISALSVQGEYAWGDQITTAAADELRYGVPVPLVNASLPYGTHIGLDYRLGEGLMLGFDYRESGLGQGLTEYSLQRLVRRRFELDLTLLHRRSIRDSTSYTELDLEMPLDQRNKNSVGVQVTYNTVNDNYSVNFRIKLASIFSWGNNSLVRVPMRQYLNPAAGGIKGLVYLDINADGHHDEGEPGLENIGVLVNGRKKMRSGSGGYFYLTGNTSQPAVTASLDIKELDAIYTPTQGRQDAIWNEHSFTRVTLGVAVLGSISGKLLIDEEGKEIRALPGTVVLLKQVSDNEIVARSVTDDDGEYFLGEVKPGKYLLALEPLTYPASYQLAKARVAVNLSAGTEPEDLTVDDMVLIKSPAQGDEEREAGTSTMESKLPAILQKQ